MSGSSSGAKQPGSEPRTTGGMLARRAKREVIKHTFDVSSGTPIVIANLLTGDVVSNIKVDVTTLFDGASADVEVKRVGATSTTFFTAALDAVDLLREGKAQRVVQGGQLQLDVAYNGSTTGVCTVDVSIQRSGGKSITTLGELMMYVVERVGNAMPIGQWQAVASHLTLPVAGYIDTDVDPWEYLIDTVLPLAQVSLRHGEKGVYPVLWQWWAGAGRAIWHLQDGVDGVCRLPDVASARPSDEIITSITMKYGWDPRGEEYRLTTHMNANPRRRRGAASSLAGDTSTGNLVAASQRHPDERHEVFESRIIYDRRTADWVARQKMAASAWSHRRLEFDCPQGFLFLTFGDLVTVTCPDIHVFKTVGIIVGRELTDLGRLYLTVLFGENPATMRMTTGPNADNGPGHKTGGPTPPT